MEIFHADFPYIFSIAVHGLQFAFEVSSGNIAVAPSGKASADFGMLVGKFMGRYFKSVSRCSRRLTENA